MSLLFAKSWVRTRLHMRFAPLGAIRNRRTAAESGGRRFALSKDVRSLRRNDGDRTGQRGLAGRCLPLALAATLCACASRGTVREPSHVPASDPPARGHASEPIAPSPLAVPLDPATLSALPRERVRASAHGTALDCEGISLAALLRNAGALPEGRLPGAQLSRYVLVDARDGYRVLYSLAELDPGTGHRRVFLVDRCNGTDLDARDGPLRLIAPEDARPARWVRQVKSITVVSAP